MCFDVPNHFLLFVCLEFEMLEEKPILETLTTTSTFQRKCNFHAKWLFRN